MEFGDKHVSAGLVRLHRLKKGIGSKYLKSNPNGPHLGSLPQLVSGIPKCCIGGYIVSVRGTGQIAYMIQAIYIGFNQVMKCCHQIAMSPFLAVRFAYAG